MPKVQITDTKIKSLGTKLGSVSSLANDDKELLAATFALAGEAVKERARGTGLVGGSQLPDSRLADSMLDGFRDSVGPQIGGVDPLALDIGVDININF